MDTVIASFMVIICVIFVWELSLVFGFGGITFLNKIDLTGYEPNPFDTTIINNYSVSEPTPFVSNMPVTLSVLFKYYIQGRGLVFRFSKLSKQIDIKYKELRNANINT